MGSNKRKRESYATPTSNDAGETSKTPETSHTAPSFTAPPFKIVYAKPRDVVSKKRKKNRADDRTVPKDEAGFTDKDKAVTYMVTPGALWDSMKKYKNFIVLDKQFAVHDYVYVNNGQIGQFEEADDDKQFWIARVLEVRASSPASVYLRVYWLYWPSELPGGVQSYHGKSELVASNHMEIIDATTVSDKADVPHLLEQEDAPTVTGLYWRQKFDYTSKRLSPLKRGCICKEYHNPDKLLVYCNSNSCGKWMHEDCILKDAKNRAWVRLMNPNASDEATSDTIEVNGDEQTGETIPVTPKSRATGSKTPQAAINGSRAAMSRGGAKKKTKVKKGEYPWEGSLEAKLQMRPVADDEASAEITGKVLITDLRDDEEKSWEEQLTCLLCRKPL